MTTPVAPALRLIKWGSKSCPACAAMDRSRLLERFQQSHPDVVVIKLDVNDEEGDAPRGSEYEKNYKLSDVYGVESLPTLVFETLDGGELAVLEGGAPMHTLEKTYRDAKERLEAAQQIKAPAPEAKS